MADNLRFLIVEDDFFAREIIQDILSGYGMCHIASHGEEAVEACRKSHEDGTPYHLVCMDIMMSGMNGFEAASGIRAFEKKHGIGYDDRVKIIMISALEDPINVMKALSESEADSYVVKPVERDKLIDEIRKVGLI